MRTIGLIGGMSWESSALYYRLINEAVRERLGGQHSAKLLLASLDFAEIEELQRQGEWVALGEILAETAAGLERAGAELLVLCTNTMHRVAPAIGERSGLPLLHIADPTGAAIKAAGLRRIALLGTRFTMEAGLYAERLRERHGLEPLVPDEAGRELVHRIIYEELTVGRIEESSRAAYREVIDVLAGRGAEGVILGCTEIGLLVGASDSPVPLFDTTALHAEAAVEWALR